MIGPALQYSGWNPTEMDLVPEVTLGWTDFTTFKMKQNVFLVLGKGYYKCDRWHCILTVIN